MIRRTRSISFTSTPGILDAVVAVCFGVAAEVVVVEDAEAEEADLTEDAEETAAEVLEVFNTPRFFLSI